GLRRRRGLAVQRRRPAGHRRGRAGRCRLVRQRGAVQLLRSMMAEPAEQIVTTPEALAECCAHLATQPVIVFATECSGEQTCRPRLCLVQVAGPGQLYLIDPLALGSLDEFWRLLLDPARTVVVHAGREEVRLCRVLAGRPPANLFDLQLAA